MTRQATAFTQGKMDTDLGTEPLTVLKISWKTGDVYYSGKDVSALGAEGRIMSFSGVTSSIKANNVGVVSSSTFTLSDYDGALKSLYDDDIMEFLPAEVYYGYEGGGLADLMLLYKGRVGTPISWSEGTRTLTFSVVSNYKDSLVGAEIKAKDYDRVVFDTDSESEMKPMSFGTPVAVKAVRVHTVPTGVIQNRYPLPSPAVQPLPPLPPVPTPPITFTVLEVSNAGFQFQVTGGELFPQLTPIKIRIGELEGIGDWIAEVSGKFSGISALHGNLFTVDGISLTTNPAISQLMTDGKIATEPLTDIIINLDSRVYLRQYTDELTLQEIDVREIYVINDLDHIEAGGYEVREVLAGWDNPNQIALKSNFKAIPTEWWSIGEAGAFSITTGPVSGRDSVDVGPAGYPASQGLYLAMDQPLIGRPVWDEKTVASVRQSGKDGVPFTVEPRTTYFTGDIFTTIKVQAKGQTDKQVNEFPNLLMPEDTGSGPLISIGTTNPIEIIEHLIINNSNQTPDPVTFTALKPKLDKYEMNFTLSNQRDVLNVIEDIAFQCRVGLNYDGQNVKAVYLSEESPEVMDIDEKEINSKTMVLESVPVTSLITKYTGSSDSINSTDSRVGRRRDRINEKKKIKSTVGFRPLKFTPRGTSVVHIENDNLFGITESDRDFYCYGFARFYEVSTAFNSTKHFVTNSSIQKSVDFWGHRFANPWRIINIINFQNTMKLEIFDIVRFIGTTGGVNVSGIAGGGFSNIRKLLNTSSNGLKGFIIETKQNPNSDTVNLKVLVQSVQGQLSSITGEALIEKDFWLTDSLDPLTQGPSVPR